VAASSQRELHRACHVFCVSELFSKLRWARVQNLRFGLSPIICCSKPTSLLNPHIAAICHPSYKHAIHTWEAAAARNCTGPRANLSDHRDGSDAV